MNLKAKYFLFLITLFISGFVFADDFSCSTQQSMQSLMHILTYVGPIGGIICCCCGLVLQSLQALFSGMSMIAITFVLKIGMMQGVNDCPELQQTDKPFDWSGVITFFSYIGAGLLFIAAWLGCFMLITKVLYLLTGVDQKVIQHKLQLLKNKQYELLYRLNDIYRRYPEFDGRDHVVNAIEKLRTSQLNEKELLAEITSYRALNKSIGIAS